MPSTNNEIRSNQIMSLSEKLGIVDPRLELIIKPIIDAWNREEITDNAAYQGLVLYAVTAGICDGLVDYSEAMWAK